MKKAVPFTYNSILVNMCAFCEVATLLPSIKLQLFMNADFVLVPKSYSVHLSLLFCMFCMHKLPVEVN
uniref:Uncharacterized protein n=1 Tax=Rhipicephalus microplus TaxID=6941 RepID=A0A6G5A1Y9_RHIMP